MINYTEQVSKKEKTTIVSILNEYNDIYRDFYITKENLRLFIKDNQHLLFDALKKGDKIVYSEEDGLIFITGWSDSFTRKYLKILSKNEQSAEKLLKIAIWHTKEDIYIKIKKINPILKSLNQMGFEYKGNRGKELLLYRKYIGEDKTSI